jgi:hypothetical protein
MWLLYVENPHGMFDRKSWATPLLQQVPWGTVNSGLYVPGLRDELGVAVSCAETT